jgi:uncharacterized protein YciI
LEPDVRKRRVIVMIRRGVAWGDGPPEAQFGWDEHAAWIDALVDRETIAMGGPFSDNSGAMLVLEGVGVEEAELLFATDPFVKNGVFVVVDVREWTNYVDTLTARAALSTGSDPSQPKKNEHRPAD